MNLIEIRKLQECRKKLERVRPKCDIQWKELQGAKDILDDILEFKIFPEHPEYQ